MGARRGTTRPSSPTSIPATTPGLPSSSSRSATRSLTHCPCEHSGSASASDTPDTWPNASRAPESLLSPSPDNRVRPDRSDALHASPSGELNVLFTADLFNEGLDIPDCRHRPVPPAHRERDDLPPAARPRLATLLDQGRPDRSGLRRTPPLRVPIRPTLPRPHRLLPNTTRARGRARVSLSFHRAHKSCSTSRRSASCSETCVHSFRQGPGNSRRELRALGDVELATFLAETGLGLSDVLRPTRSWTDLRRKAGVEHRPEGAAEQTLARRGRKFAHVDDPVRERDLPQTCCALTPRRTTSSSAVEQAVARMLYFGLFPRGRRYQELRDRPSGGQPRHRRLHGELAGIVAIAFDETRRAPTPLSEAIELRAARPPRPIPPRGGACSAVVGVPRPNAGELHGRCAVTSVNATSTLSS